MAIDGSGSTPQPKDRHAALLIVPLLLVLALAVALLHVVYRGVAVEGPSMEPTMMAGERLLTTKTYTIPERGDVVVIEGYPEKGSRLIKRVVGLPGDTVQMVGDHAYVNGTVERYTADFTLRYREDRWVEDPIVVPEGAVFVLGDNRPVSLDSRKLGPIPLKDVIGEAFYRFWPLNRLAAIPRGDN